MLKSVKDNYPFFDPELTAKENYNQSPLKEEDFSAYTTVVIIIFIEFRVKDSESRHRMWFIFDNNLILPEYLIEFDYQLFCNLNNEKILINSQIGNGM